jgi:hypothetical protein
MVGRVLIPIGSDLYPSTVQISKLRTACVDGGLARSAREQVMEKQLAQLPRGKLARPSVSDSRRAWELRGALPERVKALNEKRLQSKAPLGGFVTFVPSLARCQLVSNDDVDSLYREVADGVRTNGSSCKAQSPDDALAVGSDRLGLICRQGDPMVNDRSSRRTYETIDVLDRHVQDGRDRQDGRVKASRTGRVERTRISDDALLLACRTIAGWLGCHRKAHWSNSQESNVQTNKEESRVDFDRSAQRFASLPHDLSGVQLAACRDPSPLGESGAGASGWTESRRRSDAFDEVA